MRTTAEYIRLSKRAAPIGEALSFIMQQLAAQVRPGVTPRELDASAYFMIARLGYQSSCLGAPSHNGGSSFPAHVCISPNNAVVHGVPNDEPLKAGDIVKLDLAINDGQAHADMALTVPVGQVSADDERLMQATYDAMWAGMNAARVGATVLDVSKEIEAAIRAAGFYPVPGIGGHGIGAAMHEDPYVGNSAIESSGEKLQMHQMLAIEPVVCTHPGPFTLAADGWTILGPAGSRVAQFEHTIVVGKYFPDVLTEYPDHLIKLLGVQP